MGNYNGRRNRDLKMSLFNSVSLWKVNQSRYRPGQAQRILRKLRFPDFMTMAQVVGRLSALRTGRHYPQEMLVVLISIRGWVDPRAIVRSEGFCVNELFHWHRLGSNQRLSDFWHSTLTTVLPRSPSFSVRHLIYWPSDGVTITTVAVSRHVGVTAVFISTIFLFQNFLLKPLVLHSSSLYFVVLWVQFMYSLKKIRSASLFMSVRVLCRWARQLCQQSSRHCHGGTASPRQDIHF